MSLVRWQPASFFDLRNDMSRVLDTFRGNESTGEAPSLRWRPSVDIAENQNEYIITADLPGINRDDLEVTITDGRLTIRGERQQVSQVNGASVHRVERVHGTFTRTFDLPSAVAAEQISAAYRDGVLSVTVQKAEEAKPKQIEVKISA